MKNIRILTILSIILFIFFLPGCLNEMTGKEFKQIWDDAIYNSAVSYWYLGENNGYHYIQERWPSRFTIYKISVTEMIIKKKLKFTLNKKDWINLKRDDIEFLKLKHN